MVQQITNGIKISVNTQYQGTHLNQLIKYFIFSYAITIENQTDDVVQLVSRRWYIFDALKQHEIIDGEGVIGEKPILLPKQLFSYRSNCLLISELGSMRGFFKMINITTNKNFKVLIPSFQLTLPQIKN